MIDCADADDEEAMHAITLSENPMDIAFKNENGTEFACALITGTVEIWKLREEEEEEASEGRERKGNKNKGKYEKKSTIRAHSESVRAIAFAKTGSILLTGSGDKSVLVIDCETERAIGRIANAHDQAITRMTKLKTDENVICTGCDEGVLKIWDVRQERCAKSFKDDEIFVDFVSEIYHDTNAGERNELCVTSGDGTVATIDLSAMKVIGQSDNMEDELLSCCVMKNGTKVVTGSQGGNLNIFNHGKEREPSDRFQGHPSSVDAMLKVSEDIVLTGSSDGLIRVITISPNQMLGLVGEHGEYPIERMSLSDDLNTLASASHDHTVKIWDVSFLREENEKNNMMMMDTNNRNNNDDDDDDDSDSEQEKTRKKHKKGKAKNKVPTGKELQNAAKKKQAQKFFEGL
jgi:WD repeat-containing protein 55